MIDHSTTPYYLRNFDAERIADRLVRGGFHPDAVNASYYGVRVNVRGLGEISAFEDEDAWTIQLVGQGRNVDLDRNADPDEITADSLRDHLDLYILGVDPARIGQPDDE